MKLAVALYLGLNCISCHGFVGHQPSRKYQQQPNDFQTSTGSMRQEDSWLIKRHSNVKDDETDDNTNLSGPASNDPILEEVDVAIIGAGLGGKLDHACPARLSFFKWH